MLSCTSLSRAPHARQARASAASQRPLRVPAPNACLRKPVPVRAGAGPSGDDSDAMIQDNWETVYSEQDLKEGKIEGTPVETQMKTQDIGQGKTEPDAAEPPTQGANQPMGTEYGQAAEQRTSSDSSSDGASGGSGSRAQEMSSDAPAVSEQGGRFDEEPVLGDHPYDPRPRERGHGVPPHKDSSNTGPGSSSSSEASSAPQSQSSSQGETTADTTARDEFNQGRM